MDTSLHIRPASAADIPAIIALERDAVTASHWPVQQYEGLFSETNPQRVALVIEEEHTVKGFLVARAVEREWEIENIAVVLPERRKRLGSRLLGDFLDFARGRGGESVFLEVRESNRAARALYEKWAFAEVGRRNGYYHEPDEDAVVYRLTFV